MHTIFHTLHHVASLVALALFLFALWRSLSGLMARGGWLPSDEKARRVLPIALDVVFVLGILVWATLEPSGVSAFGSDAPAGHLFKAVIHPVLGCAILALVHIGSVRTRKLSTPRDKFRTMGAFYLAALLLVVAQSPFHG